MQRMGLTLSSEDIYSINKSSLKDAVVQLDDGGCTAELISSEGLILTNHHCAVSDIQYHSTPQNNLLQDGFWASSYEEELPVPGKTALILLRVEDVTDIVVDEVKQVDDQYFERVTATINRIALDVEKNEKGTYAEVVPMYNHNKYYLFVYHRFTDVRLVGAPPSSIGNFGGDIDNWRWPRHTGDFTLFRIYCGPDGMPANYSKKNKPYQPKHHFTISLDGVNEGDFAMVLGFPGTTYRFSSSANAEHERDVVAPWVDRVWGDFIEVLKDSMKHDISQKVHYTDKHDMLVNFWQKDTYQAESMYRFNVVERLKQREKELKAWAMESQEQRQEYLDALESIDEYFSYIGSNDYEQLYRVLNTLIGWPIEISDVIYEAHDLFEAMLAEKGTKRKVRREVKKLKKKLPDIYDSYFPQTDMKLYSIALINLLENLPDSISDPIIYELNRQEYPEFFVPVIVEAFFNNSYFTSSKNMKLLLDYPKIDSLTSDPLFMLQISFEDLLSTVHDSITPYRTSFRYAMRTFTKGLLELETDKVQYPDANSTMRLSYGKVVGYSPRDGVSYRHMTYLDGKIEKEDPEVDVYYIEPKIKELWVNKDFGEYADTKGLPVCFTTDNDISNGNSGSPVLNGYGQLVGVAFDGNYEAMASDFIYEPSMQRTIVTDIRYVLFVIDKFAGAKRLIEEMTIAGSQSGN